MILIESHPQGLHSKSICKDWFQIRSQGKFWRFRKFFKEYSLNSEPPPLLILLLKAGRQIPPASVCSQGEVVFAFSLGGRHLKGHLPGSKTRSKHELVPDVLSFSFSSNPLYTSLDQRLICWNPINSTLDDGKWILFLLHYLCNSAVWECLGVSTFIMLLGQWVLAQPCRLLRRAGELEWGRGAVLTVWTFSPCWGALGKQ